MAREMIQQGGRSARIQAGVTPSTLYRRWGDLSQLLADVAVAPVMFHILFGDRDIPAEYCSSLIQRAFQTAVSAE